jgi:hypothetical protein
MEDKTFRTGLRTIATVLLCGALAIGGVLTMLGGQVSTVLSQVGSSITSGDTAGGPVAEDSGGAAEEPGSGEQIADAAARPPELLIIRTGQLELEVTDLPAAVAAARRDVAAAGGYVSSSEESAAGEEASASVVYRIPADRWDEAVASLRGLATEVRHAVVETEAVTGQVADLGARITNLRASEAALQAIMAQATKISDVLDVQAELTGVRGEIEQLVAQKQGLEERAAFGTLSVVFRLPATPVTEEVQRGWDPATDVDRAAATLIGLGQGVASGAIWLAIVGLPLLLTLGLIVVVSRRLGQALRQGGEAEAGTP